MKEVSPQWLLPRTPDTEVVRRLEAELEVMLAEVSREEGRLELAKEEAAEEVCHRRLAALVRAQDVGDGAGAGAGA
jgi:hypothetical protein